MTDRRTHQRLDTVRPHSFTFGQIDVLKQGTVSANGFDHLVRHGLSATWEVKAKKRERSEWGTGENMLKNAGENIPLISVV